MKIRSLPHFPWMILTFLFTFGAVAWADDPTATPTPTAIEISRHGLQIIGANVEGTTNRCSNCHTLDADTIQTWAYRMDEANYCLHETETSALDKIKCLKNDEGEYSPEKLGFLAAAYWHGRFKEIFQAAYPDDTTEAEYNAFKLKVRMPQEGSDLVTETDFAVIEAWLPLILNDQGLLAELLRGSDSHAPQSCVVMAPTQELSEHIARMRTEGWGAVNQSLRMQMFGCDVRDQPLQCFTQKTPLGLDLFPLSTSDTTETAKWNADMPQAKIRILYTPPVGDGYSYWIRSSPDGRFVAAGGVIFDLEPALSGQPIRVINVDAPYDPQFFPDGSGVNYAGGDFCPLSVLQTPGVTQMSFEEPGCIRDDSIGLYQSIGATLGNATDKLAISGRFAGDYGQRNVGSDGDASWLSQSKLRVHPMVNTGNTFEVREAQIIETPYNADWQLAPSTKLVVSRVSGLSPEGQVGQMGYQVSMLTREEGSEEYTLKKGAQFCADGGKATFSYDERFITFYHYLNADEFAEYGFASASDPAFQEMVTKGVANIYIHDITTGITRRITRMNPGQNAMFPHFRSDGWLTFMVKDGARDKEYFVTTDAALLL